MGTKLVLIGLSILPIIGTGLAIASVYVVFDRPFQVVFADLWRCVYTVIAEIVVLFTLWYIYLFHVWPLVMENF